MAVRVGTYSDDGDDDGIPSLDDDGDSKGVEGPRTPRRGRDKRLGRKGSGATPLDYSDDSACRTVARPCSVRSSICVGRSR